MVKTKRVCFQGDRFGGALDGAAKQFSEAYDSNLHPMEFVNSMRKKVRSLYFNLVRNSN